MTMIDEDFLTKQERAAIERAGVEIVTKAPQRADLAMVSLGTLARLALAYEAAKPVAEPVAWADEIEREMMAWRGANGGIYTIRACAFAVAQKVAALSAPASKDGG